MKTKYKKLLILNLLAISLAHTNINSDDFLHDYLNDTKERIKAAITRTAVAYTVGTISALYANNFKHKIATPTYAIIGLPIGAITKKNLESQINSKNTSPSDRIELPKYIFPMTGAFTAGYLLPILLHKK